MKRPEVLVLPLSVAAFLPRIGRDTLNELMRSPTGKPTLYMELFAEFPRGEQRRPLSVLGTSLLREAKDAHKLHGLEEHPATAIYRLDPPAPGSEIAGGDT